jgi:hypothetical protein
MKGNQLVLNVIGAIVYFVYKNHAIAPGINKYPLH